jgi:hypothetical protein
MLREASHAGTWDAFSLFVADHLASASQRRLLKLGHWRTKKAKAVVRDRPRLHAQLGEDQSWQPDE